MTGAVLEIEDLRVRYDGVRAVDGVSFAVHRGETLALVGESGSGKSTVMHAILGLAEPGTVESGRILLEGVDLRTLSERELRRVRGSRVGIVFQDPASALNPVVRAGEHVVEAIRAHRDVSRREAREQTVRLLREVRLPDAERLARAWPHELSGGMQQRVMLAVALANRPAVLLADEPTSALDVTVQAQILALLRDLRAAHGLAVVLVTHDLRVVAGNADRVAVMSGGKIVEHGPVTRVLSAPEHPYTAELLAAARAGLGS